MEKSKHKPTIKDVAELAGVSIGTVSKVINGRKVGDIYKHKVDLAIADLGYQVNNYARGLRNDKTNTIAVIVPTLIAPYFAHLVDAINDELNVRGKELILSSSDYDPKHEQQLVDKAQQQMVDGIICLSYNSELSVDDSVPFVSIDRYIGDKPCVTSDNYSGGRLAAKKLHENGCSKLLYIHQGSVLDNEPKRRGDGFADYCKANKLEYDIKSIDDGIPFSEIENYIHREFEADKSAFDGIFCVTDKMALETISTLNEMGLSVPNDVQVIGFDGIRKFGDLDYYCSTIVQPTKLIAKTCVELVLSENLDELPSLVQLPISYAYGGTTIE